MEQNLPRKKADKTGIAFFEEVPKGNGFTFNTGNSSGGGSTDTGSLLTTASISLNTITFTKGDSSTFNITVDTGSQNALSSSYAESASFSQTASYVETAQTASYVLNAISSSYALSSSYAESTPSYTNSTPTPIDFPSSDDPNIPAGTTFSNKTFTEMMDLMLYPELFPTLTNPSNTFTMSPSGLREIGEVISTITLNASFNRGSISPAYGTSGFRSGLPNTYVYTGTGTSNNSSTSLTDTETVSSYTVLSGVQSWTGAVSYDAGPQPLSSKGNNYNSPLPAGTTLAITRTIRGVYPPFATTATLGTLTKQSLQTMTTLIQVSMVAEDGSANKQTIDIPNAWSTITGLQQYNTLSGTWDTINLSTFTTSSTTQTIQGNTVNYTRYTHNGSTIGERDLRFIV